MSDSQSTADVLMIRPSAFGANDETAESNRFQRPAPTHKDLHANAAAEFDELVRTLRSANVNALVFDDTESPRTPDAIFPNNWVSFHADGSAVLYPMLAPNRRLERRGDIFESLVKEHGFRITRTVDLTHRELGDCFLEGTGSLVLDRVHRVAYACTSPRTHLDALGEFAQLLDYDVVVFDATDRDGHPIYHTNVMLSIGARFAAVCTESIRSDQRSSVVGTLRTTGHQVLELTYEQLHAFAGNLLELTTTQGGSVVAMSKRAHDALNDQQRHLLTTLAGPIVTAAIPTIEAIGGGSVRCMLAEIHLPRTSVR